MRFCRQELFSKTRIFLLGILPQYDMNISMRRYTLNVSRDVYVALQDLRNKELRKQDKAPTVDQILRKLLKIEKGDDQ
jgi:hypothetical protein